MTGLTAIHNKKADLTKWKQTSKTKRSEGWQFSKSDLSVLIRCCSRFETVWNFHRFNTGTFVGRSYREPTRLTNGCSTHTSSHHGRNEFQTSLFPLTVFVYQLVMTVSYPSIKTNAIEPLVSSISERPISIS